MTANRLIRERLRTGRSEQAVILVPREHNPLNTSHCFVSQEKAASDANSELKCMPPPQIHLVCFLR